MSERAEDGLPPHRHSAALPQRRKRGPRNQGQRCSPLPNVYMWNQYSVGVPREQIFVTTKFWCQAGHGRSAAVDRLKESLALLMLTYVDLYLVHSPGSAGAGRAQSWAGMEDCVKQGLARSIGVSNYGVEHLKAYQPSRLIFYRRFSLTSSPIHFSMSYPLRLCRRTPPSRLP